jgi:hypothetical protein
MEIDWTDATCQITPHFTVGDAITLHTWGRLATADDGLTDDLCDQLVLLCQALEQVRDILGCPMNVHCMLRTVAYNTQVLKLKNPNDVHALGMACDFDCGSALSIDQIHALLLPKLEELGIRMEQNTPTWCHVDIHPVGIARYFLAA